MSPAVQADEQINDDGHRLEGRALKLCTFKVGEAVRGRKIGELFLKAAFRYATENACEHVFIHASVDPNEYLIQLLQDFGFEERGMYRGDLVLVKRHPRVAPDDQATQPFDYAKRFFPHFRRDGAVRKFLVPIKPQFHKVLFPDYNAQQQSLFGDSGNVGNAIKLAYLCHAQTNEVRPGDVLLFYRTDDERSVTSIGVVERFETMNDAVGIASLVRRRTVYGIDEIEKMATRPTKVILFRIAEHLPRPVSYDRLRDDGLVTGPIQSPQDI